MRAEKKPDNDILIIDTDPQGSSTDWVNSRFDQGIESIDIVQFDRSGIESHADQMRRLYQDVIIDSGARDSKEMRMAMTISDVMVVPFSVSRFGKNTAETINDLLEEAKNDYGISLDCLGFANNFKKHPSLSEAEECVEELKQYEYFETIETIIHNRIAFVRSNDEGMGVNEMKNNRGDIYDRQAIQELTSIYNKVYNNE